MVYFSCLLVYHFTMSPKFGKNVQIENTLSLNSLFRNKMFMNLIKYSSETQVFFPNIVHNFLITIFLKLCMFVLSVALWTFKVMELVPDDHMLLFFCIDYTIWPGAPYSKKFSKKFIRLTNFIILFLSLLF